GFGIAGADHVSDNRIPADAYLGVALDARLVGLIGSQNVAPVNQRDFGREIGEEESLFDGGISSADHHDLFALEEESIARSAGGNTKAFESFFVRQAQPFGLSARRDDQRIGGIPPARVARHDEWPDRQIRR